MATYALHKELEAIQGAVSGAVTELRKQGDKAVNALATRFDTVCHHLQNIEVHINEIKNKLGRPPPPAYRAPRRRPSKRRTP
jgi:histidinol dehydrogenase